MTRIENDLSPYDRLVLDVKLLRKPLYALEKAIENRVSGDIALAAKRLHREVTAIINYLDLQDNKSHAESLLEMTHNLKNRKSQAELLLDKMDVDDGK